MDFEIKKRFVLKTSEKNKFKNIHIVEGKEITPSYELQIVIYPDVEGFYLFYLDVNGQIITDTYHDTLKKALEQAEWEFNILPNEWIDV